jgi:hypothetical protein
VAQGKLHSAFTLLSNPLEPWAFWQNEPYLSENSDFIYTRIYISSDIIELRPLQIKAYEPFEAVTDNLGKVGHDAAEAFMDTDLCEKLHAV